jgi:hypothetical protein
MTESSAQDRSGQDRISAPLALHEVDAITNFTRDASQSANDQDQSLKVGKGPAIFGAGWSVDISAASPRAFLF